MTTISSLIYSGYSSASSSRQLASDTSAEETVASNETASGDEDSDPISTALKDAEALGEQLASGWEEAKAKAEMVYLLITGDEMDSGETQDLITNMLLTAYDELHESSSDSASLEDMPSYALALAQWASSNGVSSTYSITA